VDADLSSYFDLIPHAAPATVAKRVSDGACCALIKAWLRGAHRGKRTGTRGRPPRLPPTGVVRRKAGVISPLLANLYSTTWIMRVDEKVEQKPDDRLRYADDP